MSSKTGKTLLIAAALIAATAATFAGLRWQSQQKAQQQIAERKTRITENCHSIVRERSKYPSKAVFTKTDLLDDPGVELKVLGIVELMNGFGAMIPHNYMCNMNPTTYVVEGAPFLMREGITPEEIAQDILEGR